MTSIAVNIWEHGASPILRISSRSIRQCVQVLLLTVVATTVLLAGGGNVGVAPPNSSPHGMSYGHWGAEWWQWVFSLPLSNPTNPLLASGAVNCSYGQFGHVWFLVGSLTAGDTVRSCRVPTGRWLFFPVYNSWADNTGNPPTDLTIEQLRELAASFSDASELHATIDGVAVPNLFAYRGAFAPFGYTVPPINNLLKYFGLTVPGQGWPTTHIFPVASDGYWLMLEPLPPGPHTINFGGTSNDHSFSINITYQITVVPEGRF